MTFGVPRRSCLLFGLLFVTLASSGLALGQSPFPEPAFRARAIMALSHAGGARPVDPRELAGRPTAIPPLCTHADGDEFWGDEFGLPIPNSSVACAAIFQGDLIIGGGFTQIGGRPINHVARWSGTEWVPVGGGVDG